jgi:hypothetical protein
VTSEPELVDNAEVAEDQRQGFLTGDGHWLGGQAIELDRTVSPSGNVKVGPQQFWIGPAHAGRRLGFWMDTTTVHLSLDGVHLKMVPSRQTTVSLTRLRSAGARPAGPPPTRAIALSRGAGSRQRLGTGRPRRPLRQRRPGPGRSPHHAAPGRGTGARHRRRRAGPHSARAGAPALRPRLHGVRLASPERPVPAGPLRVQRRVSGRGVTQVAGQTLRVGYAHRHTLVDIDVHETEFHIYDRYGEPLAAIPRTSGNEVTRTKGYGVRDRIG